MVHKVTLKTAYLLITMAGLANAEQTIPLTVTFAEVLSQGEKNLPMPVVRFDQTYASIYLNAEHDIQGPIYLEYKIDDEIIGKIEIPEIKQGITRLPDNHNSFQIVNKGLHEFSVSTENGFEQTVSITLVDPVQQRSPATLDIPETEYIDTQTRSIENDEINFITITDEVIPTTRSLGSDIYNEISKTVVLITNKDGLGSGAIIDGDGIILTNAHVVGNERIVTVRLKPESIFQDLSTESFVADVIYKDETRDLAIVKMRYSPQNLPEIALATFDDISVGDDVHAIGHPFGNTWSYTRGYISQFRPNYMWLETHTADVIQTQTPINPGNSGGPLILNSGELIGINSFADTEADGLNYAVAISSIYEFLNDFYSTPRSNPQPSLVGFNRAIPFDEDQNGYAEWQLFDEDANQIYERAELDIDENRAVDKIYFDDNQNLIDELIVEYRYNPSMDSAVLSVWYFDENEDGKIDRVGYDFDLDGKVDSFN